MEDISIIDRPMDCECKRPLQANLQLTHVFLLQLYRVGDEYKTPLAQWRTPQLAVKKYGKLQVNAVSRTVATKSLLLAVC